MRRVDILSAEFQENAATAAQDDLIRSECTSRLQTLFKESHADLSRLGRLRRQEYANSSREGEQRGISFLYSTSFIDDPVRLDVQELEIICVYGLRHIHLRGLMEEP